MATKTGGESPRLNTDDELSVEHRFEGIEIHGWKDQLTLRVFVISFIVGSFMTIVLMKLCLSLSLLFPFYIPIFPFSLIILESSITALDWFGLFKNNPITRQEISVMHACVVGFSKIVYYGGFADYLFAMSEIMAKEFKTGRNEENWTTLKLGWIIIYLFLVCFIGLFTIIPAAKVFIVRYRLMYPSGFFVGHFINVFHTQRFSHRRKEPQMQLLLKSCCGTLLFEGFRWLYTGGYRCGFYMFPTFGLQAAEALSFYSSLTPAYIAIGLICPHSLAFSFFIGAIISWGVFWPFIRSKEGVWYPMETSPEPAVDSSYGYRVSLTFALFLGEGIFQLSLVALHTWYDMYLKKKPKRFVVPFHEEEEQQQQQNIDSQITATMSYDDQLRTKMFLKDIEIPTPISIGGFLLTTTISAVAIPFIFPEIEPRHIAAAYMAVPILNFCNAYSVGISNLNFAPRYGKLTIFIFGSWIGISHGGVLGSLIASSIVIAVMSTAADLIQNFKLAYMTLTSPRSLLIGQVIGIAMGCIIVPIVFFYFYNLPNFGDPDSDYAMDSARNSRAFAIQASQGLDSLPMHCITLAVISFMVSLSLNIVKEMARFMNWRFHAYIPSPVAMAIPFYFQAAASLDICMGSLVLFVWKWKYNKKSAELYIPTVATGLFFGDCIRRLISTLLYNNTAPMCVRFFSRDDYMSLLNNLSSQPS